MSSTRGWTLTAATAMGLGTIVLAPVVVRHYAARLGAGESGRAPTARAPKPEASPILTAAPEAPRVTPSGRRGDPSTREVRHSKDESDPGAPTRDREAEADDGSEDDADEAAPDEETEPGIPPELAPAARNAAELAVSVPLRAAPELVPPSEPEVTPALEAGDEDEAPAAEEAPEPASIRGVPITVLEARTQPGLCRGSPEARHARAALVARFDAYAWDEGSRLYLDPRLSPGAHLDLIAELERAEAELSRVLALAPPRPDVFAYHDTRLLLAGGCTNDGVVAYYDGALHVVPSHGDAAQSVLHEYTHHALTAAGLLGPAWAQEGIAMHMAGETWWREGWMQRVLDRPFSLEAMESAVPYTLVEEQAGLFYAQSAAMVSCALRDDPRGLRGLVESLAAGQDGGDLSYQLPRAAAPAAWRSCFGDLAR